MRGKEKIPRDRKLRINLKSVLSVKTFALKDIFLSESGIFLNSWDKADPVSHMREGCGHNDTHKNLQSFSNKNMLFVFSLVQFQCRYTSTNTIVWVDFMAMACAVLKCAEISSNSLHAVILYI